MSVNFAALDAPTLLLDAQKAQAHVARMAAKAERAGVTFRPHFKTHQSAEIGGWFHHVGVDKITVSSVGMARYFADHGWRDITVAFPLNVRQLPHVAELANEVTLHLLLDETAVATQLDQALTTPVHVWLEIDAGYHRTGLPWQETARITAVARTVAAADHLRLAGLLTHAGDTYHARSRDAVLAVHDQTVQRMQHVQAHLCQHGLETAVSIGDTPACSLADTFTGVDEIRPGNFIFYDLMQQQIGACTLDDIAVAVACPVVGVYPQRGQIAVYGGAVHLSKEALRQADGSVSYGRIALPAPHGWTLTPPANYVSGLSQEHGLVQADADLLHRVTPGDLLLILPVHSCLTANLLQRYRTLDNRDIFMANM